MSLRSAKLLEHAALDLRVLQVVKATPGITVSDVYARLNTGVAPTLADVDRSLQRLRKRKVVEYDGPRGGWVAK
jgi:hypothetical protein